MGKPESSTPKSDPHGLGDPDCMQLRKVETEILIPKKMREKAKTEKCSELVQEFSDCCKNSSLAMVFFCRQENKKLKACLTTWYENEDFRKVCRDEYLRERSEYRRTGIKQKDMKRYEA